ncbi:hypothetical protein RIF29_10220 [Crotalaria pallida]|uniref:Uncharacterized protein n=1 Tax=Crotalaria pallida TaxID=3830 RepID=A0AAN9ILQ6_CROPI
MARKKGRPPMSPSSQTSSRSPSNALPKNLDLENLDEDDLEDIDALSPTKAASILQKLDPLWAKIKGKAIVDDDEGNMTASLTNKNTTSPMLIKWSMFENKRSHSFKFMNHLTLDNEFLSIIQHLWRYDGEGCAMFRLMRNLERTKPGMIELKQRKYRDIDQKERLARDKLDVIQGFLHDDPMYNHLQKLEREARRDHYEISPLCDLCEDAEETCTHLFFELCTWTTNVLMMRLKVTGYSLASFESFDTYEEAKEMWKRHLRADGVANPIHSSAFIGRGEASSTALQSEGSSFGVDLRENGCKLYLAFWLGWL